MKKPLKEFSENNLARKDFLLETDYAACNTIPLVKKEEVIDDK